MNKNPLFAKIALIGVGLIGSSIARIVRRKKLAGELFACAQSEKTRKIVSELNLADFVTDNPAIAVADADLVIICTPLSAYAEFATKISGSLKSGSIVSTPTLFRASCSRTSNRRN